VSQLKPGDPDPTVTFGPTIDTGNAERIESWIQEALDGGAKRITGGQRNGAFFESTVLTGVAADKKAVCEKAFGPVWVVEP